ncbi:MAG: hypothetical protein QXO40_00130 [Candidatus Aenigmatarchaeota archaeon]
MKERIIEKIKILLKERGHSDNLIEHIVGELNKMTDEEIQDYTKVKNLLLDRYKIIIDDEDWVELTKPIFNNEDKYEDKYEDEDEYEDENEDKVKEIKNTEVVTKDFLKEFGDQLVQSLKQQIEFFRKELEEKNRQIANLQRKLEEQKTKAEEVVSKEKTLFGEAIQNIKDLFRGSHYVRMSLYYIDPITNEQSLVKGGQFNINIDNLDKATLMSIILSKVKKSGKYLVEVLPPPNVIGEKYNFEIQILAEEEKEQTPSSPTFQGSVISPKELFEIIREQQNMFLNSLKDLLRPQQNVSLNETIQLLNAVLGLSRNIQQPFNINELIRAVKEVINLSRELTPQEVVEEGEEEEKEEDTTLKRVSTILNILKDIFAPKVPSAIQTPIGSPTPQITPETIAEVKRFLDDLKTLGAEGMAQKLINEGKKSIIDMLKGITPEMFISMVSPFIPEVSNYQKEIRLLIEILKTK